MCVNMTDEKTLLLYKRTYDWGLPYIQIFYLGRYMPYYIKL